MRYLLSCSFYPRSLAAIPLLDALVGGTPDPGRTDRRTGVVTRGWVLRGDRAAAAAHARLARTDGVWGVTLDAWPAPLRVAG